MANPHKARGTAWESAVVTFLRGRLAGQGLARLGDIRRQASDRALEQPPDEMSVDDIRRQVQMGRLDIGDVHAAPFALECKNVKEITLASFVEQAEREAVNARMPYGAAVIKRRGKGAGQGYVVMSLETFARVLAEIRTNTAR